MRTDCSLLGCLQTAGQTDGLMDGWVGRWEGVTRAPLDWLMEVDRQMEGDRIGRRGRAGEGLEPFCPSVVPTETRVPGQVCACVCVFARACTCT